MQTELPTKAYTPQQLAAISVRQKGAPGATVAILFVGILLLLAQGPATPRSLPMGAPLVGFVLGLMVLIFAFVLFQWSLGCRTATGLELAGVCAEDQRSPESKEIMAGVSAQGRLANRVEVRTVLHFDAIYAGNTGAGVSGLLAV